MLLLLLLLLIRGRPFLARVATSRFPLGGKKLRQKLLLKALLGAWFFGERLQMEKTDLQ